MSRKKYFTPRDVDPIIPELEKVFEHISMCKGRAEVLAAQPDQNPWVRSHVAFLLEAVQDDIHHIMILGGVTKDLDAGLVDFPGQLHGEEVWLCWKRGEPRVRYWHAIDEGFSQRQALRRPEAPGTFH